MKSLRIVLDVDAMVKICNIDTMTIAAAEQRFGNCGEATNHSCEQRIARTKHIYERY